MAPYIIERELRDGEKMLWKGIPKGGIKFSSGDAYTIIFIVFWGSLMLLGTPPSKSNAAFFATNFPMIIIVGYVIFGRFFFDAIRRKNIEYALTNERAIIVSGRSQKKVQSINLKSIPDISVIEKPNGTGTIVFGESAFYGRRYRGFFSGTARQAMAFEMINNVRSVDSLIRKLQKGDQQ